jgi:hypothetical protein
MEGGSSSAKLTWERSGFAPKDVDVARIYDGFSASVIYGLESYGFCKESEALDFIQDGRIELDGELPLNPFGGSLGTGRIHGCGTSLRCAAGIGPRRLAPGEGHQRVVRRCQRADRHRHQVHLLGRAALRRRTEASKQVVSTADERGCTRMDWWPHAAIRRKRRPPKTYLPLRPSGAERVGVRWGPQVNLRWGGLTTSTD